MAHATSWSKRIRNKMKLNEVRRQKLERRKSWHYTKHVKLKSYLRQTPEPPLALRTLISAYMVSHGWEQAYEAMNWLTEFLLHRI